MTGTLRVLLMTAVVGLAVPEMRAMAQSATLSHVEGLVFLGDHVVPAASTLVPVNDAPIVRTEAGRAVVSLGHGGRIFLNERTVVRLASQSGVHLITQVRFDTIQILSGSAIVMTTEASPVVSCDRRDVQPRSSAILKFVVQPTPGYAEPTCRLQVFDGAAAVRLTSVSAELSQGQTMNIAWECGDMLPSNDFDRTALDEFDRWTRQQAAIVTR